MARRGRSPESSDDEYIDRKRFKPGEVKEELIDLIYKLGDKDLSSLPTDLEMVADIIKRDSSIIKRKILELLVICAQNIPEKLTIYVTLIGIINAKDNSFVEEFVELLLKHFKDAIKIGNHEDTKFLLRFMSDLINTNVIPPSSVLVLYNVLIELALEQKTPRLCSDWLVYMVMYSLPWSAVKLAQNCKAEFDLLIENIEKYITENRQVDHLVLIQIWTNNEFQAQEDYIDCLWEQLKQMRLHGWRERVLWRLYNDPKLSQIIKSSRPHILPQLSLTLSASVYPLPMVIFRLFDYTDVQIDPKPQNKLEEVTSVDITEDAKKEMDAEEIKTEAKQLILPGSHSIERFLVEEQFRIILNGYRTNRKLCTKALLALPMRVELPISYMIVETIFGEIFKLPKPDQHLLYYNSLLMDLCRESPNEIPLVLAQATEMLFDRIETMRVACIERFVKWFSHHLSNFKYQWSWAEWSYCSQDSVDKPKTRFIVEVLERLLRLSFYEHLKAVMPADFSRLLPKPPGSVNKYGEGAPKNLAYQKLAQQLSVMLKNGARPDEVINFLQSIADSRYDLEKHDYGADSDSPKREEEEGVIKTEPEDIDENNVEMNNVQTDIDEPNQTENSAVVENNKNDENVKMDVGETTDKVEVKAESDVEELGLYPGVTRRVIDVFITVLLNVSNKTFTHSFLYIEKYKKVILEFVVSPKDEVELLHSIYGVWQEQQQYVVVLIQRFLELEILTPRAVLAWIFSDELSGVVTSFYFYEIIVNILDRVSHEENSAWAKLQEVEESTEESEIQKSAVKKAYARARKNYMDLVKCVLAGVICKLNNFSTAKLKDDTIKFNLVDLLIDYSSQPKQENIELSKEVKFWLLGRIEELLFSVDLPHNYLIKSLDDFFKSTHVPDEVLEIYGTFRSTVNQSS